MLKQALERKTTQALLISRQMQQSLQILHMPTYELKELIEREIETNPFIEATESISQAELPYNNQETLRYEGVRACTLANHKIGDAINDVPNSTDLKEHLTRQVNIEIPNAQDRFIALYLTDLLDDNGYLTEPLHHIASFLQCTITRIRSILRQLYKLEPIGAYAQNLEDCLEIQLKEKRLFNAQYNRLLVNLHLLATGRLQQLAKICKVDDEKLHVMIKHIQSLDPKPGRNFSKDIAQTIIPDAYVYRDAKGDFRVMLNQRALPYIELNNELYQKAIQDGGMDAKAFCKEHYQKAGLLYRSIKQRSETIMTVVKLIIHEQYEFFEKGIAYLKPMILSQIAQKAGVHESTISRVSNKFIATPAGNFEIKYFFTSGVKSNIAENTYSSSAIKNKIRIMVENEDASLILADDKIAQILNDEGIAISRRTVTKYREAAEIPSSYIRKRLKMINGQ